MPNIQPHIQEGMAWYNPKRYDFGISEKIQQLWAPNTAYASEEQGSNLLGEGALTPVAANDVRNISGDTQREWATTNASGVPVNTGMGDAGYQTARIVNSTADSSSDNHSSAPDLSNPAKRTDYAHSQGYDNWDMYMAAQNQSKGPDMDAINSIYEPTMNFLNQEYGRIEGQLPGVLQSAKDAYESSFNTLNTSKDQTGRQIAEQDIKADQSRQREEDESRQMYNEMLTGGTQRFGRASSAGQAYEAILGREQQRGVQQIVSRYQDAKRAISDAKIKLQEDFANKKMDLEQKMRETQQNIRMEFSDRLAQIRQMKASTESAKASAKYDALQQYNAQMQNLRMATMQYQQQLALQAQANSQQIAQAESNWENYMGQAINGAQTFDAQTQGAPQSQFGIGPSTNQQMAYTPIGIKKKKEEDSLFPRITA